MGDINHCIYDGGGLSGYKRQQTAGVYGGDVT